MNVVNISTFFCAFKSVTSIVDYLEVVIVAYMSFIGANENLTITGVVAVFIMVCCKFQTLILSILLLTFKSSSSSEYLFTTPVIMNNIFVEINT